MDSRRSTVDCLRRKAESSEMQSRYVVVRLRFANGDDTLPK